jgi:phosphinothricin acetyltransferase
MDIEIRAMRTADWPAVSAIYAEGIATGQATFQTDVPECEQWDKSHLQQCRLVAIANDSVVAWAAISPVSSRAVYAGVVEVSVYVSSGSRGRGIGRQILTSLITETEADGRWTLQAGIFPENEASVALHVGCGFRIVGVRRRIGRHNGGWRDALFLERRSSVIGV